MAYDKKYLDSLDKQKLMDAIHSAVSFTYIDGEKARLYTRLDLKRAAGWLTEHEENEILNRLKEIDGSESITKNTDD